MEVACVMARCLQIEFRHKSPVFSSVHRWKHYFNVNRVLKRDFVVGKFGYFSKLCLRTTIKLYIMDMDLMSSRESVNKSTKWKANGEQHALAVT